MKRGICYVGYRCFSVLRNLFLILAVVLGCITATAYKSIDTEAYEDAIKYPSIYSMEDAVKPNYFLGAVVASIFVFFSAVCFGIASIIGQVYNVGDGLYKKIEEGLKLMSNSKNESAGEEVKSGTI